MELATRVEDECAHWTRDEGRVLLLALAARYEGASIMDGDRRALTQLHQTWSQECMRSQLHTYFTHPHIHTFRPAHEHEA